MTIPISPLTGTEPASPDPVKEFHLRWADRVGNLIFRGLSRIGVGPASMLITTGRRTGRPRRTPVIPVRRAGRQWLVSPYGNVAWLLNARASGQVELHHGRHAYTYSVREVAANEAGSILKQYVAVASATRPYFRADRAGPMSEFVAEAHLHPVLELTEAATGGR